MNPNPKAANGIKYLLSFTIFILLIFAVLGFYYEQNALREFAQSIAATNKSTTNNSNEANTNLNNSEIDKINNLFFDKTNYQSEFKKDIETYGRKNNIKISNYSFSDASNINGVQTVVVDVRINESIEYSQIIQFMQYIETSLPKMQIVGLNLERNNIDSKVIVKEFKIEAYL